MKYRHIFHAGNFADLHKHLTWMVLLQAMQRKEKGFLVVDTHAGSGFYDLRSAEAKQSAEASINLLPAIVTQDASAPATESGALQLYMTTLDSLRRAATLTNGYPGSPVWSLSQLRPQDRMVCFEVQPAEHRQLEKNLAKLAKALSTQSLARIKTRCADGYAELAAWLPPIERRALILIDPPYENSDQDYKAIATALTTIMSRFSQAVIALWYPIKHRADTERALGRLLSSLSTCKGLAQTPESLRCELWRHPCDSKVGLNGSGMLVINPPWQVEERLRASLPRLHTALDERGTGGWQVIGTPQ